MFTEKELRDAERDIDNDNWYRLSSADARAYVYAQRAAASHKPTDKPGIGCLGFCVLTLALLFWLPIIIAILLSL